MRNGVARVEVYPQGAHSEPFVLGTFGRRNSTLVYRGGDENVGCRAEGAKQLRLVRCEVRVRGRVRAGGPIVTLAQGERTVEDRRSFKVDTDLTKSGRALLRRRPRGSRVSLVIRATDSIGRTKRLTRRVTVRPPRRG